MASWKLEHLCRYSSLTQRSAVEPRARWW